MISQRAISRNVVARSIISKGSETTEYEAMQSGGTWSIIAMILGFIGTYGSVIAGAFGADTTMGIVVGTVISISGLVAKILIQAGYIKSRAEVKVAAASVLEADAKSEAEEIKAESEQQPTVM